MSDTPVRLTFSPVSRGRLAVQFPYSREDVALVKQVPGASWSKTAKLWTLPQSMDTCWALRKVFGKRLQVANDVSAWARGELGKMAGARALVTSEDAELVNLPTLHPQLAQALRGYQRVGVRFAVEHRGELLAYVPGLGKTLTSLAAVGEANGTWAGHHLVTAMRRPCRQVWEREIAKWLGDRDARAYVAVGSRQQKQDTWQRFIEDNGEGGGAWYITTYQTLAVKEHKDPEDRYKTRVLRVEKAFPDVVDYPYTSVIIDETHKVIRNLRVSGGGQAATGVKYVLQSAARRGVLGQGLSGTPMPKKAEGLFGTLHALRPDEYRSFWNWAKTYFNLGGKYSEWEIGALDADQEEQLYQNLDTIIHRRTRGEVMPGYPEPVFNDIWCELEGEQKAQYQAMVDGDDVDGVDALITLDEILKLTQLAWSACDGRGGALWPRDPSCKLDALLEKLDEFGVLNGRGKGKHLVFTQFERNVQFIVQALRKAGVECYALTGKTSEHAGDLVLNDFMDNPNSPRVLVMTTQTGGVSLNLEMVDDVHLTDEMWNPDDNEQAWLRGDRGSRTTPLRVWRYRTLGTVDEYRLKVLGDKEAVQRRTLDERRGVELVREILRHHRKAA